MRFPEFTNEWEKNYLSKYLVVSSLKNKNDYFTRNDVLSVSGDLGCVNQIQLLGRSFAGASLIPYHVVELNDIVYTKSPLAEYPYGIIKTNRYKIGIVSTLYAVYKTTNHADNKFIEHYFGLKSRINNYLKPIVRIGAKHDMKIGNSEVLNNYVIFPNVPEQKKIAIFIDLLNQRIDTQSKIIEDLELFEKEINNTIINKLVEYKDLVKFSSIYNFAKEGGTPNTSHPEYYTKGSIPFVKIDDLTTKYLVSNQSFITKLGLENSSAWLIPANSILYSNGATIGAISINKYPVTTKQGILGIVPKSDYLSEYLYYFLRSNHFKKEICKITTQGTMKSAYIKDIDNILVPRINKNQQNEILTLLSEITLKIQKEKDMLELYKKQKAYLLKNMFI